MLHTKEKASWRGGAPLATKSISNKIRDLFKVKLYAIRSETKAREREREREKKFFINPNTDRWVISDPN